MGRQIALELSREKEKQFSEFLKKRNSVIILPWSEGRKVSIIDRIPNDGPYLGTLYIWNRNFKFKPSFTKIKEKYRRNKYRYHIHIIGKPIIEYSRGGVYRIYWEKYFVTNNPEYDVEQFERWYNEVVKWVKKNCKYVDGVYR